MCVPFSSCLPAAVLEVALHSSVRVNATLPLMQAMWDTIDALLHFEQYFARNSLSVPQERALGGNVSAPLQQYCRVSHLLPAAPVSSMSSEASLGLRVETNETPTGQLLLRRPQLRRTAQCRLLRGVVQLFDVRLSHAPADDYDAREASRGNSSSDTGTIIHSLPCELLPACSQVDCVAAERLERPDVS